MCRTFGVSPSGFYAWRSRPESTRAQEDRRLKVLVHASFTGGRGAYGSPRIYDDFVEWQEPVSRKRIIRLMQEDGLKARVRKRFKGTTMSAHDQPVADNLLRPQFTAERPNQRWVGDTSELRIGENGQAYPRWFSTSSPGSSWAGPSVPSMIAI
jgi:putative transposase